MTDEQLLRLFGFLTGDATGGWSPRDHLLEVQDGQGVQDLLGAGDWVNFLSAENFVRLARLAAE